MALTPADHDRDAAGLTYVYPVVSRRARGVSVGVNLNPNSACNWRCLYCQVPDLTRGAAPEIDLELLERELRGLLGEIVRGDWMERNVPQGFRLLNDVAFSGNGEPTTSRQLEAAIEVVHRVLADLDRLGRVAIVLITNGSMTHREDVRAALGRLASHRGEVWFKLDRATAAGRALLNDTELGTDRVRANLAAAARLCPTRLQTMMLAVDGAPPPEAELAAWIELVRGVLDEGAPLRDVLLYGLARESHQPEAPRLSRLPDAWLEAFAQRVRDETGLPVSVHP